MRGVINKAEQFLQRLRWKVHFFFNPPKKQKQHIETFGFTTRRNAPPNNAIIGFEHDLTHLISNFQYSEHRTSFQKKISKDANNIRKSKHVFVMADKTSNVYQIDKTSYNKLMRDSVTSHYEKTTENTEHEINSKAKQITQSLQISDRVEPIAHLKCLYNTERPQRQIP